MGPGDILGLQRPISHCCSYLLVYSPIGILRKLLTITNICSIIERIGTNMRIRKLIKIGSITYFERKIVPVGNSLAITLPKSWVDRHGLKSGDTVEGMANSMLTIIPKRAGGSQ